MTLFVINIGETVYSRYSLPLIKNLCEYNGVNLFILDKDIPQNTKKLHPSWLKLFCHDLVDDDFIVCWDLDLIPKTKHIFVNDFNKEKLNFCIDWSLIKSNERFNHKFNFNCGLIGIPKTYSDFFKNIYYEIETPIYPSYEQYYVNDKIYDHNIEVHKLSGNLNYFYDGTSLYDEEVKNIHYTWKINSNNHRIQLIKDHYEKYQKNF